MTYHDFYSASVTNPAEFWKERAKKIKWYEFPKTILPADGKGHGVWYEDGTLNTCYLCLDKHVEDGNGQRNALIYDSPVTGTKKIYTYAELTDETAKTAGMLKCLGVGKGDRVIIYMPMVPEALIAMLACARLGAVHSVVFGGFAPHELRVRIDDAKPNVILTATCGIEFTRIIPYRPLVQEALGQSDHKPETVVVLEREECPFIDPAPNEKSWRKELARSSSADCVPVEAGHPLYILYTSGTTGKPKGVVRDNGGYAVAMNFSMEYTYKCAPGDVFWAASDIGWVVGHSYIVYAPLIRGATTLCYEGKPIRTPDAGAFWRVISEYGVNHFFTAPTAFRAIKKEDPNGELPASYNISSLKNIFVAGERMDPPTQDWLVEKIKKPVLDHWWQTETGWSIVANPIGIETFPVKTGSSTLPVPGYAIKIKTDEGDDAPTGENGNIVITLPLPPGCLSTLWNNRKGFYDAYLATYEGYYLTGDGGYVDSDGYVFIMGRIDDVINVSGHRLSTGEMEELIASHSAVAECAVVGIEDELKGQIPIGFYVLKDGVAVSEEEMDRELVQLIRNKIGAVAVFKNTLRVKRLPKTRSGKILRKLLRRLADENNVPIPGTIDDPAILGEIKEVMETRHIGRVHR